MSMRIVDRQPRMSGTPRGGSGACWTRIRTRVPRARRSTQAGRGVDTAGPSPSSCLAHRENPYAAGYLRTRGIGRRVAVEAEGLRTTSSWGGDIEAGPPSHDGPARDDPHRCPRHHPHSLRRRPDGRPHGAGGHPPVSRPRTRRSPLWGGSAAARCRGRGTCRWRTTACSSWMHSPHAAARSSRPCVSRLRRVSYMYNLAGVLDLNSFAELALRVMTVRDSSSAR
jgi:hypothetical protein